MSSLASLTPPPGTETNAVQRAIALKLASVALFAVMAGMIKYGSPGLPVGEVVFLRSLFAFVPLLWLVRRAGGLGVLRTNRIGAHLRRSVPGLGGMMGGFAALSLLPLADATAINFAVPVLTTLLAIPLLGERVGIYRGSAILVGFIGMLIIVRPGEATLSVGALYGLAGATSSAFAMVAIRRMEATEPSLSIVFYFTLFCTLGGALLMSVDAIWPPLPAFAVLASAGMIGGVAQILMTRSYRLAAASIVAPFDYTALLFAMLGGFALWGEVPSLTMLAGAALVVASGLFILYRERQKGIVPSVAATPATKL
jgi:drug/metabolite transporter (DMT)-like permease